MNRELRRAQAKAEAKAEKEKKRARRDKQARREERKVRRSAKPKQTAGRANGKPRNPPGRFSSVLTLMVVVFIVLQAATPILTALRGTEEVVRTDRFTLIVEILYYALLGYFAYLWLARAGVRRALYVASGLGAGLAVAAVGAQLIAAQTLSLGVAPKLELFYFGIPAVIGGAFLGQLVWTRAPR